MSRHHPTWAEVKPSYLSSLMDIPIDATCLCCHYFADRSDEDDAVARGICTRHAPVAGIGWPAVTENDSCGDWRTDYRPMLRTRSDVA